MNFKSSIYIVLFLGFSHWNFLSAQELKLQSGQVSFYGIDYEDIAANTDKIESTLDLKKNEISVKIPISTFLFEKSLMQEHFNEKYMESDKYPVAFYKGKISGFNTKNGKHKVSTSGKITIHGVTKDFNSTGEIEIKGKELVLTSILVLKIEDFNIKTPKLFFVSLTEEVRINLIFNYKLP